MKMNFILPSANDFLFRLNSLVLEHDVVGAALNDGCGGHDGQARVLLKIRNVQHTAVAHGGAHLVQRGVDVVGMFWLPIEEFSTQPPLVMKTRSFSVRSMPSSLPS